MIDPSSARSDVDGSPRRIRLTPVRATAIAFYALEAAALPLFLSASRNAWFTVDDWDFLARRTPGSLHDALRAHFDHWVTLPYLVYRFLWPVAGLHYLPYQALAILLHLVTAALLRVVMLRAGVRPWLATLTAIVLLGFGYGAENVLVAFQITFVGALAAGLAYLLLTDHDGPFDRRDGLGLAAGFVALMCSGVGIVMVAVAGLAITWRRGWRMACTHLVPLAAAYLIWFVSVGRHSDPSGNFNWNVPQFVEFVFTGATNTFARIAYVPVAGALLFAVLVAGLAIIFGRTKRNREELRQSSMPIALLCGAVLFLGAAAVGRTGIVVPTQSGDVGELVLASARLSRFVYVTAALALPAIALACEAILRRRQYAAVPIAALLLIGVPGNVRQFSEYRSGSRPIETSVRTLLLRTPRLPAARLLPQTLQPTVLAPGVTVGWLRTMLDEGRLPRPPPTSPRVLASLTLRLALQKRTVPTERRCRTLATALTKTLREGEAFTVARGAISVVYIPRAGPPSFPSVFGPGATRVALIEPLTLRFTPVRRAPDLRDPNLCI